MVIRKLYKIESAHIVRGCTTDRCKFNYHGHSGKIEVFLKSKSLDNAGMVIDFGRLKHTVGAFIDMFDHAVHLWNKDKPENIKFFMQANERYIIFPFNPSAENYAVFFKDSINNILKRVIPENGEDEVYCSGVRYHETDTGYAESDITDQVKDWFRETVISEGCLNDDMKAFLKNNKLCQIAEADTNVN